MKNSSLVILLTASLIAPTWALAARNPTKEPAPAAQQQAPNITEFDKQMGQAQENLGRMEAQMAKIQQSQDPQERRALLQEHWSSMQNGMSMMQGIWGNEMMGSGHLMGWQGMRDYYSKMTIGQMIRRQYMVDRYMGMQQMMINQLMQHQYYSGMQPPLVSLR